MLYISLYHLEIRTEITLSVKLSPSGTAEQSSVSVYHVCHSLTDGCWAAFSHLPANSGICNLICESWFILPLYLRVHF